MVTHNRGDTLEELKKRLEKGEFPSPKKNKCVLIQRYLVPLLYNSRKFDLRSYMLVTFLNNQLRVYSY